MPMADPLAARYKALFRGYGVGRTAQIGRLKRRIAERESVLREDAMFFLLVNMDHMVIQGLSAYIPDASADSLAESMPRFAQPKDVEIMVNKTLEVIEGGLARKRQSGARSSANDVVRVIAANSKRISDIVLWWKE